MSAATNRGGVSRAEFLARVASGLGRRGGVVPPLSPPAIDDFTVRLTAPSEDLNRVFASRAAAAGMTVHRVCAAEAEGRVIELVSTLGIKRVAIAGGPSLAGMRAAVESASVELVPWTHEPGVGLLYESDAGLTDVQAAIAESGTLVCWSSASSGRGLSLVPPIHIALVRRSDIVPDLIDYLARHSGPEVPASSIVFITGPSKTADIEGILITGVHGPREVHIVLIEDA